MARAKRTDNKGRVLKVGESQDKSGRYAYKWTDATGKRSTVYALDLLELRQKEKQIQRDLEEGISTKGGDITLNQLFDVFIETKSNIRKSTNVNYRNFWDVSVKNSIIGEMKINQIKQMHIKRLYADLKQRGLSGSSIQTYHVLISSVFQLAVDSDLIRKNPCRNCRKVIKVEPHSKKALTIRQQEILLEYVNNSNVYNVYCPMLNFAFSTALRIGEIIGLRQDDIDMKENVVHIRRQLIYKNYGDGFKFHVTQTKTQSGNRDIPLTQSARKALIKQKELDFITGRRSIEKEIDGMKGFVFINSKGMPMLPFNFNAMLRNVVNSYNKKELAQAKRENREPELLPHISAHILRHTACTRMAEAGIDPKTLQYIMGHSDISTTMDIYNHVDSVRVQNEMKKFENVM